MRQNLQMNWSKAAHVFLLVLLLFTFPNFIMAGVDDKTGLEYSISEGKAIVNASPNVKLAEDGSLVIPSELEGCAVTALGDEAFAGNTKLTSVVIPATVVEMGNRALECENLHKVEILSKIPAKLGSHVFDWYADDLTIYLPKGTLDTYKQNHYWNLYEYFFAESSNNGETIAVIDDNNTNGITAELYGTYEPGKITYKRKFNHAGDYAVVCIPFGVSDEVARSIFSKVYFPVYMTKQMDGSYSFTFMGMSKNMDMTEGSVYLVKLKDDVGEINLENQEEVIIDERRFRPSRIVLQVLDKKTSKFLEDCYFYCGGTYQQVQSSNYYTFNSDCTFRKANEVEPFRMYLEIPSNVIVSSTIVIDNEGKLLSTGILGINKDNEENIQKVYTLDGTVVNNQGNLKDLDKGIYIRGGKKIVVK